MTKREILKAFAEIGTCPPDLDCIDCSYRQKCDKLELVLKKIGARKLLETFPEERRFVNEQYVNFYLFYPETGELLELEKKIKCAENGYSGVDISNTIDIPGKTEAVWHDLRKCPEDLPEKGQQVIIAKNGRLLFAHLREDNVWTTDGHNAFENVTAWCRTPGAM